MVKKRIVWFLLGTVICCLGAGPAWSEQNPVSPHRGPWEWMEQLGPKMPFDSNWEALLNSRLPLQLSLKGRQAPLWLTLRLDKEQADLHLGPRLWASRGWLTFQVGLSTSQQRGPLLVFSTRIKQQFFNQKICFFLEGEDYLFSAGGRIFANLDYYLFKKPIAFGLGPQGKQVNQLTGIGGHFFVEKKWLCLSWRWYDNSGWVYALQIDQRF